MFENNKLIYDHIGMYTTFENCIDGLFKQYDVLKNYVNPLGFKTY